MSFTVSALYFCAVHSFSELLLFRLFLVYAAGKLFLVYGICFHYSQTSFNTETKGTEPSVRFTDVSVL